MATEWRLVNCSRCGGWGVVMNYAGVDPTGAGDCPDCNNGVLYVTPTDRVALWPGGPFQGRIPGAYERGLPMKQPA